MLSSTYLFVLFYAVTKGKTMANHSSLSGNNSNKSSGLVKAGQSNSAGSKCDKANGSDNATQPANRELERAFGIRMPQRKQRTAAEKRAMVNPEMLDKALSTMQLADHLQISVKTLKNRIDRIQVNGYPDFITLPGSKVRVFPIEWIVEWRQQKTWIHGAVTKIQQFKN